MANQPLSYQPHPDYVDLPEAVKATFSERDYSVMADEERKTLLHDMTMPEVGEDA